MLKDGVVSKAGTRYFVGSVPPGFRVVQFKENDVAYESTGSPHTIAVNATCEGYEDAPLEVLTQHLLMGFTEREKLEEARSTLDGRECLRTHVKAKLDGVPREIFLVVLKKNSCVYDLTYVSAPGRADERYHEFEKVVEAFRVEAVR